MAKAFAIALLVAAAAVCVAANGGNGTSTKTINISMPDVHGTAANGTNATNSVISAVTNIHNSVQASIANLSASLQDAAKIHHGDLSGCDCNKECEDTTQEVCKVTVTEKEECKDVEEEKDYLECATKCYKADHVVEINIPTIDLSAHSGAQKDGRRRLLESTPVVKADGSISHPLSGLSGDKDGATKEICREVCKPGKRPVAKQVCEPVEEKKYDCKDEVVATKCVTNCKCGDKVAVQIKEVPDYLAAAHAALASKGK